MATDDPYGRRSGVSRRGDVGAPGGGAGAESRGVPGGAQPNEARDAGDSGQDKSLGQTDKPSMLRAITTPKGGGAIKGIGEKFEVAAATGTASLSVPLPCRR